MPRPVKNRWIYGRYEEEVFKPRGRGMTTLEAVHLEADELEAIRLADFEGLYQSEAAEKMGISRQTFGNILNRAHQKVADALIHRKMIRMNPAGTDRHLCVRCGQPWTGTATRISRDICPECDDESLSKREYPPYGHRHRHGRE
ncbi:DUF134 domain-containing protein [Fidelibacter multiformis]|uniref:DUF134 domain-containing protein n=1 Tax=Fidelibacter multiformis TaxID=3377529 RepID=UPI0037DD6918